MTRRLDADVSVSRDDLDTLVEASHDFLTGLGLLPAVTPRAERVWAAIERARRLLAVEPGRKAG